MLRVDVYSSNSFINAERTVRSVSRGRWVWNEKLRIAFVGLENVESSGSHTSVVAVCLQ